MNPLPAPVRIEHKKGPGKTPGPKDVGETETAA